MFEGDARASVKVGCWRCLASGEAECGHFHMLSRIHLFHPPLPRRLHATEIELVKIQQDDF